MIEDTLDNRFSSIKPLRCNQNELESNEKLIGTYTDDLNIIEIDQKIRKKLSHEFFMKPERINELDLEIQKLSEIIKKPQTLVERKDSIRRRSELILKKQAVESEEPWIDYVNETRDLLIEYLQLEQSKRIISFRKKTSQEPIENQGDTEARRLYIIDLYLERASKYHFLNFSREIIMSSLCPNCNTELQKDSEFCEECGYLKAVVLNKSTSSKLSSSMRNEYKNIINFQKCLLRFMGKQNDKIPDQVFKDLDDYFISYGLPIGESLRSLRKIDGKVEGTSREMMYKALSHTGNSKYYGDINLICHLYWGWDLPNISHLVETIMEDYRKTQNVYNSMEKERSSCLNTQFRLFKHLQARGYQCTIDDFKIVKTRDILEYYDITWQHMCEQTGLTFIPTI